MVATAAATDDRPCAIRYPRGEGVGVEMPTHAEALEIGRARVLREGEDVALLSLGGRLQQALEAADMLAGHDLTSTVVDARSAKPLDREPIGRLARHHEALITIEEGAIGGFGSHVLHFLAEEDLLDRGLKVRALTLPDRFVDHDTPEAIYRSAGLDAEAIEAAACRAMGVR